MGQKILIVNGNPKSNSFCHALADQYVEATHPEHEVRTIKLHELSFNPDLTHGYEEAQTLEPDLVAFQQALIWAEHVVFVIPVWWGGVPAKFKGLIDRTFLPDFAFKCTSGNGFPEKLLKGRTADVVYTMDTPPFYYRWIQGNPVCKQIKRTILDYCGLKQKSVLYIGPIIHSTEVKRAKWLGRMAKLAHA